MMKLSKNVLMGLMVVAFLMALVVAAPMIAERSDKIVNVTIEGAGDLSYNDTRFNKSHYERKLISSTDYNLPTIRLLEKDLSYIGCKTWGNQTDSTGEVFEVCLEEEVVNYTDAEIEAMLDKEEYEWMLLINKTMEERKARGIGVVVRQGDISDGR